MSPPDVPGYPGRRLPQPWETEIAELKRRVDRLERATDQAREKLDSVTDEWEEKSAKTAIPSDAPKLAKVGLAALLGLTPTGRAWVLGVLGFALIVAGAVLLAMRVLHL